MCKRLLGLKKTFIMSGHNKLWIILLFVFFTLGKADDSCQELYQNGVYDTCLDANCVFLCPSTSTIRMGDPENCQNYFLCSDGHLVPQRCPNGQRFNVNIQMCQRQSDYDKCQPACNNNQYKNFILMTTFPQTTISQTTEEHRVVSTTASSSGTDSVAYSETSQKETLSSQDGSNAISSVMFTPELTSTSSRSEEISATNSTNICVNLHSISSNEDVIELLCEWICEAKNIASPAEFQWYNNGFLLSNTSYVCTNGKDDDNDDAAADINDDKAESCFTVERDSKGLSSILKINASDDYEGMYQCTMLSSDGSKYPSNVMSLVPPLVLNWTQKVDLDASLVLVKCGLRRSDGRQMSQRLCDGYFQWSASNDYDEVSSSRCSQNIEVKVDFRENSTITCQWKSATSLGLDLSHTFWVLQVNDVCLPNWENEIFWNASYVNSSLKKSCPRFPQAFARRSCVANGTNNPEWTVTDLTECTYEEFLNVFYRLKAVERNEENYPIISSLASNLMTLTKMGNMDSPNLNITIQCLKLLTNIRSDNIHRSSVTDEEIKSVMGIVSNILEGSNMESWKALRKVDADVATAIMKAIDLYLVQIGPVEDISQSNLAIKASKVPENSDGVLKIQPTQHNSYDRNEPSYDNVSLSLDFFKSDNHHEIVPGLPNQGLMVYTALYTNLEEILPVQKNNSYLASRIMMITSSGLQLSWVSGGMNITFAHTLRNISAPFAPSCVFWNFSLGQNGEWSNNGCRVVTSNENMTSCSCDHMTNFAILMTVDQEVLVNNMAIRTISLIGCIVSIVSLCLTIVILALTWKRVKMSDHYAILINLCVALIIANVVFIAGIDKTQPKAACTTVATLLHLFFMAAFFLMLAEGVQLLLYVLHVFHVQRKFETVIIITCAWGLAVVVVGVSLAVSGTEGYGTPTHCWLSSSQGLVWAFIGPALFIILVNLCILFIVLYKASRKKTASEKQDIKSQMKRAVWNMLVISPLLGITWVFGVLSVSNTLVAFQYIFAVVNSLQGLFIFIFHGLCRQIRLNWKQKLKQEMMALPVSGKPRNLHGDTIFNRFSGILSKDDQIHQMPGAKNTARFYKDQSIQETKSPFETGSQSTESSYIGSVSSQ